MSDLITPGVARLSPLSRDGLSCDYCSSAAVDQLVVRRGHRHTRTGTALCSEHGAEYLERLRRDLEVETELPVHGLEDRGYLVSWLKGGFDG